MSSVLTDECNDHYDQYRNYFGDESTFLEIMKSITIDNGESRRRFTAIFKMLRLQWMNHKSPYYYDIFNGSNKYNQQSKDSLRYQLKKIGLVNEDGYFTSRTFDEYIRRYDVLTTKKHRYTKYKNDGELLEDIPIDLIYDYDNTMDVLRKNTHVAYYFTEEIRQMSTQIDYDNTTTLQIIKLNHIGGNPRTPIPLSYNYRCGACGNEINLSHKSKEVFCDTESCGRKMVYVKEKDRFYAGYTSQVICDDFNSLPVVSLVEMPTGEFNAAVFVCKNKGGYYLFMIAIDEIIADVGDIKLLPDEPAIWQLISEIDRRCDEQIGKHIEGMEWFKASILLCDLAARQQYTSMNSFIMGGHGVGKTASTRFTMASITPQFKIQDALSLSEPGLYGSAVSVKINDSTVTIHEAGLLARYRGVCVDEVLLNHARILPVFRSLLRSPTINKEVAGNRTTMRKTAFVVGTSNPLPAIISEQKKWEGMWLVRNYEGNITPISERAAHDAMVEEWHDRGLDWHTGQPFPDMDRWTFIFFVNDIGAPLGTHHLHSGDMKIADIEMSKMLYNHSIDNYLQFCSGIKVDWQKDEDRIIEFVKRLRKRDKIHSLRLAQDITLVLTMSAQINQRAHLIDEDFDFVEEMWSKTCDWVNISDLNRAKYSTVQSTPAEDWTIESIKKRVHEFMGSCIGTRYHLTPRGFSLISGKLEDEGAPIGLIESTIEHYKQNPSQ